MTSPKKSRAEALLRMDDVATLDPRQYGFFQLVENDKSYQPGRQRLFAPSDLSSRDLDR